MFERMKGIRMILVVMLAVGLAACQTIEPPAGKGGKAYSQSQKKSAAQREREREQAKAVLGLFVLAAGTAVLGAAGSGPSYRPSYRQGHSAGASGRGCQSQYSTPNPGQGWGPGNFCR